MYPDKQCHSIQSIDWSIFHSIAVARDDFLRREIPNSREIRLGSSLPFVMIFNLLTWDNNEGEFVVAGGVKQRVGFIDDANFFECSSLDLGKNEGDRLRFTVAEDVKWWWWWSSNDDIRAAAEDASLASRDDAAAAAARKYGLDKAAAAAIAAWFESTRKGESR